LFINIEIRNIMLTLLLIGIYKIYVLNNIF